MHPLMLRGGLTRSPESGEMTAVVGSDEICRVNREAIRSRQSLCVGRVGIACVRETCCSDKRRDRRSP